VRGGKLLGSTMVKELFTRRDGRREQTLGWNVEVRNGKKMVGHSGGGLGFITDFRMLPEPGIVAVVLGNSEDARLNAREIVDILAVA
jgi:CubicO group peptidase (beta-lactamase class C family)